MKPPNDWHLQISEPSFEKEGLRYITLNSSALGQRGDLTVWSPPGYRNLRNTPMVLLLHGVYSSHWSWALQGGAHRIALRMMKAGLIEPLSLVMPSDGFFGEGSAYLPHRKADYARWVAYEAIEAASHVLGLKKPGPLFIAGLSMGGYGALRLPSLFPKRFKAASAHSPVTDAKEFRKILKKSPVPYFKPGIETALEKALSLSGKSPTPFRFDCGRDDFLFPSNRALHAALLKSGIEHDFEALSGDHDWTYWKRHLPRSLSFFQSTLSG